MEGRIFQLNCSPGGVPKLPAREAMVNELGIVGDGHNFRIFMADQNARYVSTESRHWIKASS